MSLVTAKRDMSMEEKVETGQLWSTGKERIENRGRRVEFNKQFEVDRRKTDVV